MIIFFTNEVIISRNEISGQFDFFQELRFFQLTVKNDFDQPMPLNCTPLLTYLFQQSKST